MLKCVDDALFILCLDDVSPKSITEMAENCLHGTYKVGESGLQTGTCTNRWYDKLQVIVCEDGQAGLNFEHTGTDGHTALRLVSDVFTDTIMRFAQTIHGKKGIATPLDPKVPPAEKTKEQLAEVNRIPLKLHFRLDRDLELGIRHAEAKVSDLIQQNETHVLEYKGYGKLFIAKGHSMSPDAFVQVAFATAYFRMYGQFVNTYESVQTKYFFHGRTEACRCLTPEVVDFAEKFCNSLNPETGEPYSDAEKIRTLRLAVTAHSARTKLCAQGKGVDRHLYALKCLWTDVQKNSVEELGLFSNKGWDALNHTILSTSNCGNPALRCFGFGPVSRDGFGLGYIIKDASITVCAASKRRQTYRFMQTFKLYLDQMQTMLNTANPSKVVEVSQTSFLSSSPKKPVVKKSSSSDFNSYDFWGMSNEQ
jgi:carnitine O-acetyltransferase